MISLVASIEEVMSVQEPPTLWSRLVGGGVIPVHEKQAGDVPGVCGGRLEVIVRWRASGLVAGRYRRRGVELVVSVVNPAPVTTLNVIATGRVPSANGGVTVTPFPVGVGGGGGGGGPHMHRRSHLSWRLPDPLLHRWAVVQRVRDPVTVGVGRGRIGSDEGPANGSPQVAVLVLDDAHRG